MNRIFPFVLIAASACVAEVEGSDLLTEVLPPEDIGLLWDDSFNGIEDDVVAIVPVDVLVYDISLDLPVQGVDVLLTPDHQDARVLAPESVDLLDPSDCMDCEGTLDIYRGFYVEYIADSYQASVVTDVDGIARAYVEVDAFPLSDEGREPISVQVEADGHVVAFRIAPE